MPIKYRFSGIYYGTILSTYKNVKEKSDRNAGIVSI
jgi:hypothetical protein